MTWLIVGTSPWETNRAPAMIEKPCYAGLFVVLGACYLGAPWFQCGSNLAGVRVLSGAT